MKNKILLLLAMFAALAMPAAAADGKPVPDGLIQDHVMIKLAGDQVVKGGGLDINVKDGVVTLRGNVQSDKVKAKAEALAKKVKGVKSVNNELKIVKTIP